MSTTTSEKLLDPISPGEMLVEEFLKPLEMSNYRLAKEIGVPAQRIGEIIAGRRSITADTDLRLCKFFRLSDGWWMRLQCDHDARIAKVAIAKELARIKPLTYEPLSDERIRELEEANTVPPSLERRVQAHLSGKRARSK